MATDDALVTLVVVLFDLEIIVIEVRLVVSIVDVVNSSVATKRDPNGRNTGETTTVTSTNAHNQPTGIRSINEAPSLVFLPGHVRMISRSLPPVSRYQNCSVCEPAVSCAVL